MLLLAPEEQDGCQVCAEKFMCLNLMRLNFSQAMQLGAIRWFCAAARCAAIISRSLLVRHKCGRLNLVQGGG